MRSLTLKLTLAFLIVSVLGAALAALFIQWATAREFNRFVLDQAQSTFVANVTTYYQTNGSWTGVEAYIRSLPSGSAQPSGNPQSSGTAQPPPNTSGTPGRRPNFAPPFVLVDQSGVVLIDGGPYHTGDVVTAADLAGGLPIQVNGQTVGAVLFSGGSPSLDPRQQSFLANVNQALLIGALGAAVVALIVGIILARTLGHPIHELTQAIRAMAKGQLHQQVSVRSRDELGVLAVSFNQMSADLVHANEIRRQLTADIAHDLRTPLTVIAGYVESLRDGILEPSTARFNIIYSEVQRLQHLVDDLRTLSLADAGELRLECQAVPPATLLQRVAATFQHKSAQQEVALSVEDNAGLAQINVDVERMVDVLSNLVDNALRYTPAGGRITLSAQHSAQSVQMQIADTGQGIAPEALPRIFDRFYRADPSRQQDAGESGLGLAIARSIVEAHGGAITVASEVGKGTTFTIELPLAAPA